MPDYGHQAADELIQGFAGKIKEVYGRAAAEAIAALEAYLDKFKKADEDMLAKVEAGEITKDAYKSWRLGKIANGEKYKAVLNDFAQTAVNADMAAMGILNGILPAVYAENTNYGAWQVYNGTGLDIQQNLYDAATVKELIKGRDAFPKPSVNIPKDLRWNKQKLNAEITQGILQGQSIQKIAQRVDVVAGMGYAAAMRNARTSVTAAENMGRIDTYSRAKDMGIGLKQQWLATLDNRTRDSHAAIDGEVVEVGEKFSNGCEFPGDPDGEPGEIYNCRCTLVPWFPDSTMEGRINGTGMDYPEWKNMHKGIQSPMLTLHGTSFTGLYGSMEKTELDGLADAIKASGDKDVIAFFEANAEIAQIEHSHFRCEFSPLEGKIFMDVARGIAGDEWHLPFQNIVHESAHMIDFELGGGGNASLKFRGGAIKKAMDRDFRQYRTDKIGSLITKEYLDQNGIELNPKTMLRILRHDSADAVEDLKLLKDGVISPSDVIDKYFDAYVEKTVGYGDYDGLLVRTLKQEIGHLPTEVTGDISDMLEAQTGISKPLGAGHPTGYWANPDNVVIEFFAECVDAMATNNEAYVIIEEMFPSATNLVREFLRENTQ